MKTFESWWQEKGEEKHGPARDYAFTTSSVFAMPRYSSRVAANAQF